MIEILHIDDNHGDLDLTRNAFADCCPKISYRGMADPRQAMDYLASSARTGTPPPSLVVLDLNMPRARGQEVLAFMAGNPVLRHMPVVVLTTSTRPGEIAECLRLGAVAVVTKPDSYDELIAQVERMLKYVEDWPGRS